MGHVQGKAQFCAPLERSMTKMSSHCEEYRPKEEMMLNDLSTLSFDKPCEVNYANKIIA